jgi:hypothetical protein
MGNWLSIAAPCTAIGGQRAIKHVDTHPDASNQRTAKNTNWTSAPNQTAPCLPYCKSDTIAAQPDTGASSPIRSPIQGGRFM